MDCGAPQLHGRLFCQIEKRILGEFAMLIQERNYESGLDLPLSQLTFPLPRSSYYLRRVRRFHLFEKRGFLLQIKMHRTAKKTSVKIEEEKENLLPSF